MAASAKKHDSFVELKVKFSESHAVGHTLLLKEHSTRKKEQDETDDNSKLLVLNVPPYCNEKCLRRLFGGCGKMSDIHVQKKPGNIKTETNDSKFFKEPPVTGFNTAYITFKLQSSIKRALNTGGNEEPICLSTSTNEVPAGIKKWCLDYVNSWPDSKEMQNEIDDFMSVHDAKMEKQEEMEIKNEGVADEDGWIKVTKHGHNPGISRTEAKQLRLKAKLKRKQEDPASLMIYSYQIRESKREKIAELRRKFEEDKQKIQSMKQLRKFKPFK